jgi:hypothetical protein
LFRPITQIQAGARNAVSLFTLALVGVLLQLLITNLDSNPQKAKIDGNGLLVNRNNCDK